MQRVVSARATAGDVAAALRLGREEFKSPEERRRRRPAELAGDVEAEIGQLEARRGHYPARARRLG